MKSYINSTLVQLDESFNRAYLIDYAGLIKNYLGDILTDPKREINNGDLKSISFDFTEDATSKITMKIKDVSHGLEKELSDAFDKIERLPNGRNKEQSKQILKSFDKKYLSPENIIIVDGKPKLKCWGVKPKYMTHIHKPTSPPKPAPVPKNNDFSVSRILQDSPGKFVILLLLFVLLFSYINSTLASQVTISGVIYEKVHNGAKWNLRNSKVTLKSNNYEDTVLSNSLGFYYFEDVPITSENLMITAEFRGYRDKTHTLRVEETVDDFKFDIELSKR